MRTSLLHFGPYVSDRMARAVFVAGDPYSYPEIKNPIAETRGVTDWNIDSNGGATIEYEPEETSSNVVEEPPVGNGYRIEDVSDSQRLGRADASNLGVKEKQDGGTKYGDESNVETLHRTRRPEQEG